MILKIGEKKGIYFKVFADEKFLGYFSKKSLDNLKIKNNEDYPIDYVKKIKVIGQLKYAENKALNLLKIKDYSKKELYLKLKKHVPQRIAKIVTLKMQKLKYVNDLKYSENLAKKLILNKNKSEKFTILEIIKKGIKEDLAKKAVEKLEINYEENLKNLILKKYVNKLKDENSKKKVIASLLRKGHNYSNIINAIKNI